MCINVALDVKNKEQAEQIRKIKYPNATANQTRDAFLFNHCLDEFNEDIQVLLTYAERHMDRETVQRMLTIKADSNERLKTIAASLNLSIAATYRSIIAYTVDKLSDLDLEGVSVKVNDIATDNQLLKEKVSLLENQFVEYNKIYWIY